MIRKRIYLDKLDNTKITIVANNEVHALYESSLLPDTNEKRFEKVKKTIDIKLSSVLKWFKVFK